MTAFVPKAGVNGGLAKSALTSLLADQQKKRSDANQHRNQNTDDEPNNPMPTGLDFFRSSALLRVMLVGQGRLAASNQRTPT